MTYKKLAMTPDVKSKVKRVKILDTGMSDMMLKDALEIACDAYNYFDEQNEMAAYIKQKMDETYQATWQCIVGTRFGGSIANIKNHSVYFYLNRTAFLLYKSKEH